MKAEPDPELSALVEVVERHMAAGTAMEVVYFGGGQPGGRRTITPVRMEEKHGRAYVVGHCHQSGMEKTFRVDRMHLPSAPLVDGLNDFRAIATCLGSARLLDGMLAQIASLETLPIERALAAHHRSRGEFESFFDEFLYGGYTLDLRLSSRIIYLTVGYEASNYESVSYRFTPLPEPRLTAEIADHYHLLTGHRQAKDDEAGRP